MLKNIELFDKLSLRFNGRVLFIKDVIGDEICCWSFYGQGRKIAEVCCTSIVYATEKKQTKVNVGMFSSFVKEDRRLKCDTLSSGRWSSQKPESMRRPSISYCTSLTMEEVQTMPSWRLLGAQQVVLIISMRMRSENALSESAEFTSNVPTTALTTTSDLQPKALQPFSSQGRSLHHTRAFRDFVCINYPLTSFSPGEHCDQMSTMQPCIVLKVVFVFVCRLSLFVLLILTSMTCVMDRKLSSFRSALRFHHCRRLPQCCYR